MAMLGAGGVIVKLTRVAAVTVSVVVPEMLPDVAVIVLVPAPLVVANPAASMVATPVADEVHVTWVVRSCVVPLEYVPVAANCRGVPSAFVGFVGVTAIEDNVAPVTVRVVAPLIVPRVAMIVV